jgi:hypothetical protein
VLSVFPLLPLGIFVRKLNGQRSAQVVREREHEPVIQFLEKPGVRNGQCEMVLCRVSIHFSLIFKGPGLPGAQIAIEFNINSYVVPEQLFRCGMAVDQQM